MLTLPQHPKPISDTILIRLLLLVVVVLALLAGYQKTARSLEQKRYLRLEDMFVRVRDQLGREETQRLIDQSYPIK